MSDGTRTHVHLDHNQTTWGQCAHDGRCLLASVMVRCPEFLSDWYRNWYPQPDFLSVATRSLRRNDPLSTLDD